MPSTYTSLGYVVFPVHDRHPETGRLLWPNARIGFTTVRMVVEDVTVDSRYEPAEGFEPYREDYMVGADTFQNGVDAFRYFNEPGHKFVQNVLVGAINWAGAKNPDDPATYWLATKKDLQADTQHAYDVLETSEWAGCKIHLVTSLNQRAQTVERLMEEAKTLKMSLTDFPVDPPRTCRKCGAVKPNLGAKRLGWRRAPQGHFWECPACRPM